MRPATPVRVSQVMESRIGGIAAGDFVFNTNGWAEYGLMGEGVPRPGYMIPRKLDPARGKISHAVGVLGMLGLTAYAGMVLQCEPKPGETTVVSAASGGVGQIVGQIARLKGCRVVGIAGREEKCRYGGARLRRLYLAPVPSFAQDLKAACPDGIDIYFENVGGVVFDAVLPLCNPGARMTICGLIAHYGDAPGADARAQERGRAEACGVQVRNLSVGEYTADWHDTFLAEWAPWVASGEVRYREDVREGLEIPPLPSPRCCAARTSARPWSASRRIRLSHRNAGDLVSIVACSQRGQRTVPTDRCFIGYYETVLAHDDRDRDPGPEAASRLRHDK